MRKGWSEEVSLQVDASGQEKRRPVAVAGAQNGFSRRLPDGPNVESIGVDDRQAEPFGPVGQCPAGHGGRRCRDGPPIVLADEDEREFPGGGQIQRFKQHPLIHRTFAEE
jgi:hypothetical protein